LRGVEAFSFFPSSGKNKIGSDFNGSRFAGLQDRQAAACPAGGRSAMYRSGGRGGNSGKIDLQDIASRLEKANDARGQYMLEAPGAALLSGGMDPVLFEADVKNITNGYEEELDHLLRCKGHPGMQYASMTKMLETKKVEARKRPLSMAAAAAAKAARNAKALAATSQLQEEPSSSSLGSTQMGLSADNVKDGSQAVQFFATVDEEDEVTPRSLPPVSTRRMMLTPLW
jgi:hypothetical protein